MNWEGPGGLDGAGGMLGGAPLSSLPWHALTTHGSNTPKTPRNLDDDDHDHDHDDDDEEEEDDDDDDKFVWVPGSRQVSGTRWGM